MYYPVTHILNSILSLLDSKHDVMELKQILNDQLPKAHYDTLCYILHHLSRYNKY